jgi:carboxymethylenebutenolidase
MGSIAATATTIVAAGTAAIAFAAVARAQPLPERVTFPSADGKTTLVGYVFAPKARTGVGPAVVMMHGRGGAYSIAAKGKYEARTLSLRHKMWGALWAAEGFVAVLVDGFGPRGYPAGFPRFSYKDRPDAVNEVDVRPLDAFGALAWLRARNDVAADRIGLQGWSNGGSAALATMAAPAPEANAPGFRAALAFYPACGLRGRFKSGIRPSAPVRVFHGTADEEVSYEVCSRLVERSRKLGGDIEIVLYPDATHNFDNPGKERQKLEANRKAKDDSIARARRFLAERLRGAD